ncbi:hypothetical protein IFM89_000234 [Coptis chinensis]|uniref:Uncharacterized protein n=1 Tax=Coptis chinensis TaxID=261450 RepID=A0A835I819_9MAGN|nr:hypothetical protein IFM89_000234 [Coptis chinensis]
MGASGKWLKSAVGMKKPEQYDQEKVSGSHHRATSETSQCSSTDDAFNVTIATGVRAPSKSFRVEAKMSCYSYGFLIDGWLDFDGIYVVEVLLVMLVFCYDEVFTYWEKVNTLVVN